MKDQEYKASSRLRAWLQLSEETVKVHMKHILKRLHRNRSHPRGDDCVQPRDHRVVDCARCGLGRYQAFLPVFITGLDSKLMKTEIAFGFRMLKALYRLETKLNGVMRCG